MGKVLSYHKFKLIFIYLFFFSCPVTEVFWEGEESEMKKADSGMMRTADNTMNKAESNIVADNVKRLGLSLLLLFALRYHCLAYPLSTNHYLLWPTKN